MHILTVRMSILKQEYINYSSIVGEFFQKIISPPCIKAFEYLVCQSHFVMPGLKTFRLSYNFSAYEAGFMLKIFYFKKEQVSVMEHCSHTQQCKVLRKHLFLVEMTLK